jgi:hypothetical protein
MRKSLGALCVLLLTSAIGHADGLILSNPAYGGTGCPAGSAAVALSPDQTQISLLFDQYVVEAGGSKSFDRKNCNIAVPVHVPQGYSIAVFAIDYRGFAGVPAGGRAQLNVDYFLANDPRGLHTSKSFFGPYTSDYVKNDSIAMANLVWTPCGGDTILRANTTMLVMSNSRREQAMATVDSADIAAGLIYHLQWRQCN